LLSALRAPTPKNLLSDAGPVTPVVVYTGPTRTPAEIANLAAMPEADPVKKKAKHKPAAAKATEGKKASALPADGTAAANPVARTAAVAATTDGTAKAGNATAGAIPWTPLSSSALAASPPPDLKSDAPAAATAPKPVKFKPSAANFAQ
jgi:hypothetical protein